MKAFFILTLAAFLTTGCSNTESKHAAQESMADVALEAAPVSEKAKENDAVSQKIIREGDITFETDNVAVTRNQIIQNLKKVGGFTSEETQQSSQYAKNTLTLRVNIPTKKFDGFLSDLSKNAENVISKNIRSTDVTTQYIDNKTRLDNKKMLEKRYLVLLQKTSKMSDILAIEAKLDEIRSDIESSQGQLNYLLKQVDYSALAITFFAKNDAENAVGFSYRFRTAFSNSMDVLSDLFFGIINYWPLLVLLLLIGWIFIRLRKKKKAL